MKNREDSVFKILLITHYSTDLYSFQLLANERHITMSEVELTVQRTKLTESLVVVACIYFV